MKSQISYKAKRNIAIVLVIAIIAVLVSVGFYFFMKSNDETQAMSHTNGTSTDKAGEEIEQAQANNGEQDNNEEQNDEENSEEPNAEEQNNNETNTDTDESVETNNSEENTSDNIDNDSTTNNTSDNQNNEPQTTTQTVTTTEEVERTETMVGFTPASIDGNVENIDANITNLVATVEAVTGVESNYVINGMEITYNIKITSDQKLEGINVSAIVPEGTELVENSISDDGTVDENGKITWKVDIDAEKTISFKVTVTKTSGDVVLNATANGKNLSCTNTIDEAPVLTVVDPNRYQIEVGTEYVDKGYSAIDKEDGDITAKVEVSYRFLPLGSSNWTDPDQLDTSKLGTYRINYKVEDSMGNVATGSRVVQIVDTEAPVIAGLDNGEYVNKNEIVTITDATLDVVTINGVEQKFEGTKFQDKLTHEGTYVIVAIDKAGNRTEKTVTIDKTAPKIAGLDNGEYVNKNEIVTITDNNLETVTINGEEQEFERTEFQDKLTHEGTYVIVAIDKAGNRTEKTVTIDKTAPVIAGLDDGEYVTKNEIITITDSNLETVTINGEEQEFEGTEFQDKLTHEGTYVIVAIDKAGNKTEKTVTIDKTAPVIAGLDDGEYVNKNEIVTITDSNLETVTINGEEQEFEGTEFQDKLTHEGTYVIVAIDKAGNRTEKTVTIDKTAPTIEVKYGSKDGDTTVGSEEAKRYSKISFKLHDNKALKEYVINGNTVFVTDKKGITTSDANYQNIKQYLKENEENTIILRDMAGNESEEYTFVYDTKAPVSTFVKIQNNTENGASQEYAKVGSKIWVYAIFDEKLSVEPTFTIEGVPAEIIQREDGENKGQTWYKYAAEVTMTEDMDEGNIEFTINGYKDLAGNAGTEITATTDGSAIILDKTAPVLTVKDGEEYTIGNEPYFSKISFSLSDNYAVKEYVINGNIVPVTPSKWSDANYTNNLEYNLVEGKNTIILRDMAGNESQEYVFYYDTTPARRTATNILVYGDSNENTEFYATVGDTIQAYIAFNEKLAHNPTFILINNGVEYTVESSLVIAQEPDKNGRYVYQVLYKIDENTTFVDGEITLRVTDLEDMYGNKIDDETKPTNGHKVYFDKTAPVLGEGHPLYILNRDEEDNRKYIADGEYLRVEANFSEELAEEPVLTIGSGDNTQVAKLKSNNYSEKSGNYVYVWDIKLDNSILKLEDGTIVPFTITNVVDKAGNTATFDNSNVTQYIKDGEVIYDQVTFDTTAPEYKTLGILNVTHYIENNDQGANEDITLATTGDSVRILISFEEKLAVEPKVKINNNDKLVYDMTFREASSSDTLFYYMADFEITEDMNLPEDEITFEIYGYEDIAKNEGKTLDNSNINRSEYEKVVYDKTAPEVTVEYSTTEPTNGNVMVTMYFSEPVTLVDNDTWLRKEDGKVYQKAYPMNTNETITFVDEAGNENSTQIVIENIDKIAPEVTVEYSTTELTNGNVMVTMYFSEPVTLVDNDTWLRKEDGKVYQKAYPMNTNETITFVDEAGNENSTQIVIENIDKIAPEVTVEYSTTELTNGNVMVTMYFSEPVTLVDNDTWLRKEDGKVYQKAYPMNTNETITFADEAGNENNTQIVIENIDKTAPTATVSYSHDKENPTNGNVTVTITPDEAIKNIDGWTKNEDGTYSKEYDENNEYEVEIEDLVGNFSVVKINVNGIDREAPVITINEKDTFEVGVDTYSYPEKGTVTDNYDDDSGMGGVHMKWYKVEDDGTEVEVEPFEWGTKLENRELGKYCIKYWTYDKAGNKAEASRTITLQDTTAPVITVNEKDTFEIGVDTYDYPEDITVTDNRDGNLSASNVNIIWYYATPDGGKGEVAYSENFPWDTNLKGVVKPGTTFYIEYWIKDEAGNRGEAHRLLKFVDNEDPEIVLNGDEEIHFNTVEEAKKYEDAGATVTDNSGEDIEIQVQINWYEIVDDEQYEYNVSSVGAKGEGRYNIVYTAKDSSGNKAEVQRLVYIGM